MKSKVIDNFIVDSFITTLIKNVRGLRGEHKINRHRYENGIISLSMKVSSCRSVRVVVYPVRHGSCTIDFEAIRCGKRETSVHNYSHVAEIELKDAEFVNKYGNDVNEIVVWWFKSAWKKKDFTLALVNKISNDFHAHINQGRQPEFLSFVNGCDKNKSSARVNISEAVLLGTCSINDMRVCSTNDGSRGRECFFFFETKHNDFAVYNAVVYDGLDRYLLIEQRGNELLDHKVAGSVLENDDDRLNQYDKFLLDSLIAALVKNAS